MASARTPWTDWLAHAAHGLGLTPAAFWRLSLREWRALTQPRTTPVLSRSEFFALAARHPDERTIADG